MLYEIIQYLSSLSPEMLYLLLFILMILEGLALPIPSEVIAPLTGYFSKMGKIDVFIGLIIITLGSFVGSIIAYYIGLKSDKYFNKITKYFGIKEEKMEYLKNLINKNPIFYAFILRFTVWIRALISYVLGLVKFDIKLFLILTFLGHLIWNSIFLYLGYIFSDKITYIINLSKTYTILSTILIILLLIVYLYFKYEVNIFNTFKRVIIKNKK